MKVILGQRLKDLRENKGIQQKDFAKMMEINVVTYLHYEKGQRQPPLEFICKIAQFYGVTVDYLLGLENL